MLHLIDGVMATGFRAFRAGEADQHVEPMDNNTNERVVDDDEDLLAGLDDSRADGGAEADNKDEESEQVGIKQILNPD